jgi:uncharacterized membrane protein SpoIIM required for sporulation
MVLESLIDKFKAINKPSHLILYGFGITTIAIFLAYWVFPEYTSMVFICLTVMAIIPLMINIIKEEEKKDVSDFHEITLLKEHSKAIMAFMALFLGITLAVILWFVVVPGDVNAIMFSNQVNTYNQINARVTGLTSAETGSLNAFSKIFFNNVKVLIFCVLFSFLYGAGAIFVLTWNASVIGAAIGNYIRSNLAAVAAQTGMDQIASYFTIVSIGLFKYIIHGVPEILAYFVAALAGGIISIGVIRHDFKGRKFEKIILDSADLLLISLGILLVSAILEVWVTPFVF